LTEPVRRRPYCVVLFDEFEKAHTDVAAILLQILDDGRLTDAKGRTVDFRHAIVILTSNLDADDVTYALRPELLNRLDDVVRFRALGVEQIEQVVEMQILLLGQRLGARHVTLVLDDDARRYIAHESIAAGSGARYVARTIARLVTTPLSNGLLRGDIKDGANARVTLRDQERIEVIAA
jgi:ATP-dependent Clp protease ATP-binding subunit ClpB